MAGARDMAFDKVQTLMKFLVEHEANTEIVATALLNFLYVVAVMDHETTEVASRITRRVTSLQKQWTQERGLN